MTLPWDDNGYRVLPSAAYMDHTEKMRELSNRFDPAVEALAREFGNLVEQARVRLGGLFRPEDYPAPDELRRKFSFETKVMPLPDAGDFRVTLGDEEKERINRQITATVEASLQLASRDLWQRLYEAVSHLAERLSAYKFTGTGIEHPRYESLHCGADQVDWYFYATYRQSLTLSKWRCCRSSLSCRAVIGTSLNVQGES